MQMYADFKQKGGGVERGSREEALVEVHCKYTECLHILYIFPEYICLKNSAGRSDLRLKDIKKSSILDEILCINS